MPRGERGGALRQPWIVVAGALVALSAGGCSTSTPTSNVRGPAAGDVPAMLSVGGGGVATGVATGKLRGTESLDAFRISVEPVTVHQYRACVDAGACSAPAVKSEACGGPARAVLRGATYSVDQGDDLPVTCVAPAQARAYCAWVGGALPTSEQWQLATRGPAVQRFAWGDKPATCDAHPDGTGADGAPCTSLADFDANVAAHRVGAHPGGASPSGLQDALLAPGELVRASDAALFSACAPPLGACVAYGLVPGAIDSFEGLRSDDGSAPGHTNYAFRCVWSAQ